MKTSTDFARFLWTGSMLLLSATLLSGSFDLDRMQSRVPEPPANHIESVVFANGRWIVGDQKGNVSHSANGLDWSTVTTPYTKPIEAVTYYNGLYLALGADGRTLLLSNDLVNWEQLNPSGFPFNPNGFLEAFGHLYVVGWSGSLSRTTDLTEWEEVVTGDLTRAEGIATNGSIVVLAGANGEILTSPDGETWTVRQTEIPGASGNANSFLFVAWTGDRFVAGGKDGTLMTSPDGLGWTLVETPFDDWLFTMVAFGGQLYFPGDRGSLWQTVDLEEWTEVETGLNSSILDLHSNGEELMAVGRDGGVAVANLEGEWELPLGESNRAAVLALAHHEGVHLAGDGDGKVSLSNDTEAWLPVFETPDERSVAGLEWFLDQFVLITSGGNAYTSPDGMDWTEAAGPGGNPSRARIIDGRLWVVGRSGLVASTADLVDWDTVTAGDGSLTDIARGPEGFVAPGNQGVLYWSTNGTDWSPAGIEETRNLSTAIYFNGNYLAFGFPGVLWKSPDGTNWTLLEGFPNPFAVRDAWVQDGTLVLPGYLGQVDISSDGETWERFSLPINQQLYAALITPDRTLVAGSNGAILSSPADIAPGFMAWRDLRFNVLQRLDPLISGPEADPDGDGRANLVEYFANSQPLIADREPAFQFAAEFLEGSLHPVITFRRNSAATDILVDLQDSPDAINWSSIGSEASRFGEMPTEEIQPLDAETEEVRLRFASEISNFPDVLMRLVLSLE